MKHAKRILSLALALGLALSCLCGVFAAQDTPDTQAAAKSATSWLKRKNLDPKGDEPWLIVALCRGGYEDIFSIRMEGYQNNLESFINGHNYYPENPETPAPYNLYAPTVLAATAVGKVATLMSFGDLMLGLSWSPNLVAMGNQPTSWAYALIAADAGHYNFTTGGDMTRDKAVETILSFQTENGAFAGTAGDTPDAVSTAVCLTALAPYLDKAEVAAAVEAGKAYLLTCQGEDGSFLPENEQYNIVATAQAVIAFATLKDDPTALAGGNAVAALARFQLSNGSFPAMPGGKGNQDATCQCLLALAAYNRFTAGETAVFDMSDVYGASHNKLSPAKTNGVKISFIVLFLVTTSIIIVGFRGQLRQNKWRKEGKLNEETAQRIPEEELARQADEAAARAYMEGARARLAAARDKAPGVLSEAEKAALAAAQADLAAARAAGREAPAPLPIPPEVEEELARKKAAEAQAVTSNLDKGAEVDVSALPEVTSAPLTGKAAQRKAAEKSRSAQEYEALSTARSELEAARARREAARAAREKDEK